MNNALQALAARLVARLDIHPHSVDTALKYTVDEWRARASHPVIARSGLTLTQCLNTATRTSNFRATASWRALTLDGRDADARLLWANYLQREASAARRALQAVPHTAVLGNPEALRRIGRQLGLEGDRTDQLTLHIVATLRIGYPFRPASLRQLTLAELLAEIPADELVGMLQDAASRPVSEINAPGHPSPDQ
ncbi:hypothetical protein AB0I84_21605 [Streptomyces spectabilis]|uniref:hypothetical protein n=1 Tax=Streptomyces spectabilis TaxID=68270 RepID=UPI0033CFDC5A